MGTFFRSRNSILYEQERSSKPCQQHVFESTARDEACRDQAVRSPLLYFFFFWGGGGGWLKSRPVNRISLLRVFVFFVVFLRKIPGQYLKLGYDRFLQNYFHFIIHQVSYRSTPNKATENSVK
jgi:hypothetical protein